MDQVAQANSRWNWNSCVPLFPITRQKKKKRKERVKGKRKKRKEKREEEKGKGKKEIKNGSNTEVLST